MDSRLAAGLDSGAYTDLNRLNQFKVGGDSESNIKKVAQEFESLFLNEMLKSMRKANEVFGEGNFMNSNESKTYQDMHDQQLAVTLSKNKGGIGLASVLERQLSQMKSGPKRVNPFAQVEAPQASARAGAFKPAGEGGVATRDDSQQLNQRRLSLPSKLTDRLLAGIVPASGEGQPLALAKVEAVMPSACARCVICCEKASSVPARPSATTTQASLPELMIMPWIRSSTVGRSSC